MVCFIKFATSCISLTCLSRHLSEVIASAAINEACKNWPPFLQAFALLRPAHASWSEDRFESSWHSHSDLHAFLCSGLHHPLDASTPFSSEAQLGRLESTGLPRGFPRAPAKKNGYLRHMLPWVAKESMVLAYSRNILWCFTLLCSATVGFLCLRMSELDCGITLAPGLKAMVAVIERTAASPEWPWAFFSQHVFPLCRIGNGFLTTASWKKCRRFSFEPLLIFGPFNYEEIFSLLGERWRASLSQGMKSV